MNVLYITSRKTPRPYQDASVRYRCFNPAESLASCKITADITNVKWATTEILGRYDLIVFHRPVLNTKLEKLVNRATQSGCVVVADYDDLIFNPDYAELSPSYLNRQHTLSAIRKSFQNSHAALFLFELFSVSTKPLASEIQTIRPSADVAILHNYISSTWLAHSTNRNQQQRKRKLITYLPGTNSHHHDFTVVESLLCSYLADNPDIVLRVVGPLKFTKKLFNVNQLELVQHIPYPLLPSVIKDSWLTIAPLADTIFNNCKSGLKYFESAAFGVPVIASPINDMQRLKSDALFLAHNEEQWLSALYRLSESQYYEQCQTIGKDHVFATCLNAHWDYKEWYFNIVQR